MGIRYNEYVKKPLQEYSYSEYEIQELAKCSSNVKYFLKYIKIVSLDKGIVEFKPYSYQKDILDTLENHRNVIGLWSRQSGKTTVIAAYALWFAIFNSYKTIGIVSNKEASATMILRRMKQMYEELPIWLKPGCTKYQETSIIFDNGSQIFISATSEDALRGHALNLLICDEFAAVPEHVSFAFWSSIYPTISASKTSRIIVISTPNGMFDQFHKLWLGAVSKTNSFYPSKISWEQVKGRNKTWAKEQIQNMGKTKFSQEFAVNFLGSTNSLIDSDVLETLISQWEEPVHIDLQNRFFVYEKPVNDFKYVIGVDTAKGTGEHFSTIQVLKIISIVPIKFEQVAIFNSNDTDVYDFSEIINRTSVYYNNAHMMVENNAEGSTIVNRLWWDFENSNLVNSGGKSKDLGIRATKNTKPKAVLLMKKLIENGELKLRDKTTLDQLTVFIEEKGKFFGRGKPDDLVSSLYWACYILHMDVFDENFMFVERNKSEKELDDYWGIFKDYSEFEEDWSWMKD